MALEALDALEGWDSESEAAEGRPRGAGSFKRPSNVSSFKPRAPQNAPQYVTQAQLEASLARVDNKVKTVSDGMSSFNSRINTLASSVKKETEERKKSTDNSNKDLNQKLQLLALLPLLVQPQKQTLTIPPLTAGGQPTTATVLAADSNQTLDSLLPLLLVSGMGGSSGGLSFGGDAGGDGGGMLLLALVLAMSNR